MTIRFYRVQDPYGCLSNFSPHKIKLDGCYWPTVEHYYQAQKFVGTATPDLVHRIHQAPTPEVAAELGRHSGCPLRSDWEQVKTQVMYQAVLTKFLTHQDIQAVLLATGNEDIVEASPTDTFWGCGADGQGRNQLGKVLMQVRQEIQKRQC